MKIKQLEIQNFKAFKDGEPFLIDGKNVLVYGNNGSGKSSFCDALRIFLRSSVQSHEHIEYYFDQHRPESIVNIFLGDSVPSFVRCTLDDDTIFTFSLSSTNTYHPTIQKAYQASDFINYRLLFRFHNFSESENANLFPIFLLEFFPHWTYSETGSVTYLERYNNLSSELKALERENVRRDSRKYKGFSKDVKQFNDTFDEKRTKLLKGVNEYLAKDFLQDEPINVQLAYSRRLQLKAGQKWELEEPVLQLVIEYDGRIIRRPHTFLNEGRLTALALSFRLAAFDERLKTGDLKLLVLDDLLISLDMSLRMIVIDIVLKKYPDYQLFILTHDKSFFNILKQNLIQEETKWKAFEFYENIVNEKYENPLILPNKDALEKAKEAFGKKEYEVAALFLRKKVEEIIRIYFDPTLEHLTKFQVLETLANSLETLDRKHKGDMFARFLKLLNNSQMDTTKIQQLKQEAFRGDGSLSPADVGRMNTFRRAVFRFLEDHYKDKALKEQEFQELVKVKNKVNEIRGRVLNVGAHHTTNPLYENELKKAIQIVEDFEDKIKKAIVERQGITHTP